MPVAAILPILRKFENDAKVSEAVILNYFLSKMGDVFWDPPLPAANIPLEKLRYAQTKRFESMNVLVCPMLMLPRWLRALSKVCNVVLDMCRCVS